VTGASKLIELAQNVPISDIPSQPFAILSTGDEIIPAQPTLIYNSPPVLSTLNDQIVQYSDTLTFGISSSDSDVGDILTLSVVGLPNGLTFTDNGDGTGIVSGIVQAAPGSYTGEFTVTDLGGLSDTKPVLITVAPEDARATYTGPVFVSTGCPTCFTATVPLRATIQDVSAVPTDPSFDPNPGDISKATVTFVNRNQDNAVLCTANVVLLDPADPKTGSATCDWTADLVADGGVDYKVDIQVNGYYTRNSPEDGTIIVISEPTSNSITGAGYIINQSSAGTYAGDPGLKTNFGVNLKFNKKGTNIKGKVNIIVRQSGHVYQIKTTAFTSLVINRATGSEPGSAELIATANITDITDPASPIVLVGSATMNVSIKDYGEPGKNDTVGITVWSKSGKLLYSSNWNGAKTIKQVLNGGNIQIHLDPAMPSTMMVEQWNEIYLPLTKKN
jgi:hypothetical protein